MQQLDPGGGGTSAGSRSSLLDTLRLIRHPVPEEKRRLLRRRWEALDERLRSPTQGYGQQATGCGATIGIMPRCDFDCRGCYLGAEANTVPRLSLQDALRQLEQIRAHLGPKGNVQLTDGEVTLLPREELVALLRRARELDLIPMMMTHGDTLRRQPRLLEHLVAEGGLTEISIHIDSTQRGRRGFAAASEAELDPLRDEMAEMIRRVRKRTGVRLRSAMSVTVTADNLPEVPGVIRWCLANADAFGIVSFQPLAQVGRTEGELRGVASGELWERIAEPLAPHGFSGERTPLQFGHPDCTRIEMMLVCKTRDALETVRVARPETADDADLVTEYFGHGLGGLCFRDDSPLARACRGLGAFLQAPGWFLGRARRWATKRAREIAPSFGALVWRYLRGELAIHPLVVVSHHFMDASELASPRGRERTAACVFKVPIGGEMVAMCAVNAGGRREEYYARIGGSPVAEETAVLVP